MFVSLLATLAIACLAPKDTPDVLVIVLDDVARVDVAQVATPNLDALAAQGVTFARAVANPTCAPTRRSLSTGRWWLAGNGVPCGDPVAETPALAEIFLPEAMPGYASAVLGKWHLGTTQVPGTCAPLTQGYSYWLRGCPSNVADDGCGPEGDYDNWTMQEGTPATCTLGPSAVYEPLAVADKLVTTWGASAQPRLAVVSINLAHSPFHRPPAYLLPPGYPATVTGRQKFESMIVAYDALIGYMLTAVDLDETVVIVVGDNGTPVQVAQLDAPRGKGTTFERGIRVPLVIAGACVVNPGRTESGLVHVVDLWQTLVELAGGTATSNGISLVPALHDQPQTYHDYVLTGTRWGSTGGDIASVAADLTKLRQLDDDGDLVIDAEEFYDLAADPGETANLIADPVHATRIAEHRAWIAANLP